jgi:hypothetical protein
MTGLTRQESSARLPQFEHAFLAYMEDHSSMDNSAQAAAIVHMRPLPYPRWPTSCSSC